MLCREGDFRRELWLSWKNGEVKSCASIFLLRFRGRYALAWWLATERPYRQLKAYICTRATLLCLRIVAT